jgi:hypothetical protein
MKKVVLSISAIILILILAASVYFIFFRDKAEQVDNITPLLTPTSAPSPTSAPTATPLPEASEEEGGLYPAYIKEGGKAKYGYINTKGDFILQPIYDYANDFSEGIAIVMQGEKYLAIDESGAVIFENDNTISSFRNGVASFAMTNHDVWLYGYVDKSGQVIIEPQFIYAGSFNDKDQAYVTLPNGKTYELIDKSGKVLASYELELGNNYVSSFEDGYVIYYDSESMKYGASTLTGDTILEPKYSDIAYLGSNLFAVKSPDMEFYQATNAPSAIYNSKGEQLTDYTFYDLAHYSNGYTSASDDSSVFFLDSSGQEVTSLPSYDGSGKLKLFGSVVKAEIDGDLIYYHLDNTVIWKNDSTIRLTPSLLVKQMKFKPLRSVTVRYPKLEGLTDTAVQDKINEQLEALFTESRANITKEDRLFVDDSFTAQLNNQLLTITMSGYDYYDGAAHGMPLMEYYFIDITTGEFYRFRDLFKKDSDYKTKINEFIKTSIEDALETGESMYIEDAFTGITEEQHFYLRSDSLIIYFYPYEIAAYGAGFPEFTIPFAELADYIDTEGAFWKSFHVE